MPQLQPVVLTDNEASDVTFNPEGIKDNTATLVARTDGKPYLDRVLTLGTRKQMNGAFRTNIRMLLPVVEPDANGNDQTVDSMIVELTVRAPLRSTTALRADTVALMKSLLANPDAVAMLRDLEGIY